MPQHNVSLFLAHGQSTTNSGSAVFHTVPQTRLHPPLGHHGHLHAGLPHPRASAPAAPSAHRDLLPGLSRWALYHRVRAQIKLLREALPPGPSPAATAPLSPHHHLWILPAPAGI